MSADRRPASSRGASRRQGRLLSVFIAAAAVALMSLVTAAFPNTPAGAALAPVVFVAAAGLMVASSLLLAVSS